MSRTSLLIGGGDSKDCLFWQIDTLAEAPGSTSEVVGRQSKARVLGHNSPLRSVKASYKRRGGQRRGAATLELAIILPLLITTAIVCVDFGRFAYTYIAVTNAAREGAAYGSTHPFVPKPANRAIWKQGVEDAVAGELTSVPNYDPNKLTVSYTNPIITTVNGDRRIQITVGYPFETITNWLPSPQSRTLHRTVEMRLIR